MAQSQDMRRVVMKGAYEVARTIATAHNMGCILGDVKLAQVRAAIAILNQWSH
jgi:hypothetical protein